MAETETKTATAVELELPPTGGNISVALEEDAHYLRVTLDKSENFKVAAGERLRDLLVNQFGGNRNALRDWYEVNVGQGKEHRAWGSVVHYLGVVLKHGENASEVFAKQDERIREYDRDRYRAMREQVREFREGSHASKNTNENNERQRQAKSEYDRRKEWLSDMNVLWFKGEREWQDRWLQDRGLSRTKRL